MAHTNCTRCTCGKCVVDRAMRIRNPIVAIPVLILIGGVWVMKCVKDVIKHKKNKDAYYETF